MKGTRGGRFQKFGFFLDVGGGRRIPGLTVSFGRKKKVALKRPFTIFWTNCQVCVEKNRKEEEKKYEIMK